MRNKPASDGTSVKRKPVFIGMPLLSANTVWRAKRNYV